MARGKKGIDGVDKVVDLFPAGSHKMVERLLRRAAERDARLAGRNVQMALGSAGSLGRRERQVAANLGRELGKALRHRGDVGGNKASIRQKALDSGGRPFHFAHSVVKKADSSPPASSKAAKASAGPSGGKGDSGRTGRAAAHMRYIERELAVERTYGTSLEQSAEPGASRRGREREGIETECEREVGLEAVHATTAGAGQGYIENPVKLANGEQIVFSYGTIGDRFEDRVAFWEQLEEAEAHPKAQVQHRLIVELPHEASAQARFDMMRAFTKRFENDGVPFWAALHAPGKDNDSRNFHAHVVYSERPARRMVDPEAPERGEQWDFAIVRHWVDSSRHHRTSRPHRQDKLRAYNARNFIKIMRGDFSDVVNGVLERDDVRDGSGAKVRYDARSYKDMGVDAVPMRSINRIVADKLKGGKLTVLDGDYTKRMISAELREAAAKRDKGLLDLIALDDALRATASSARPASLNWSLPREMRMAPWANPGKAALKAAGRKVMEARHEALQVDVMERATVASLERVIAATSPKAVAAAAKARNPVVRAEAPEAEAARLLHAAALDELEETKRSTAKARMTLSFRIGAAVNAWKDLVGAPPPEISPAVKAAIQDMDERVDAREHCGPDAMGPVEKLGAVRDRQQEGSRVVESEFPREAVLPAPDAAAPPGVGPVREGEPSGDRLKTAPATAAGPANEAGAATRADHPIGAVAARGTFESDAATRQNATGPSSSGVTRPISLEDALRIKMPPTTAELAAASASVSTWIRSIAEAEPDPAKRLAAAEALAQSLARDLRDRRARFEADVAAREASRAGRVAEGATAIPRDTVATPPATPLTGTRDTASDAISSPRAGTKAVRSEGEVVGAPARDIDAANPRPVAPTAGAETGATWIDRSRSGHLDARGEASTTDAAEKPSKDDEAKVQASTPEEAADDERRRRKHEKEERKRQKQRKAVLGRKNRGEIQR